jgi:3-deoxy-D-manno-octulosonate 8-phosphate phosphatase KdsC-like HAD superfamily phosphatase
MPKINIYRMNQSLFYSAMTFKGGNTGLKNKFLFNPDEKISLCVGRMNKIVEDRFSDLKVQIIVSDQNHYLKKIMTTLMYEKMKDYKKELQSLSDIQLY